ncbi:hypothetical protein EV695_1140 [Cocleimonas flava]|uniref:Uncharacterized protein n=1 Tax=Cocleimonas flava TaxID=634765 RepID=A0A4R1F4U5_9GAMM|nr:hypothetical protein EV695_1140 [Cocleimonas flava]
MKTKILKKRKPLKRIKKIKYRFWNELREAQSKQFVKSNDEERCDRRLL